MAYQITDQKTLFLSRFSTDWVLHLLDLQRSEVSWHLPLECVAQKQRKHLVIDVSVSFCRLECWNSMCKLNTAITFRFASNHVISNFIITMSGNTPCSISFWKNSCSNFLTISIASFMSPPETYIFRLRMIQDSSVNFINNIPPQVMEYFDTTMFGSVFP